MSPYQQRNGVGTFMLDRSFAGVGRIQRASGTAELKTFAEINGMLTGLYQSANLTALRLIKRGVLHPLGALELYRRGGAPAVVLPFDEPPELAPVVSTTARTDGARDTIEAWVTHEFQGSQAWRAETRRLLRNLLQTIKPTATVEELPACLREFRSLYRDRPTTFNRTRAALQAFLRDQYGRRTQVYLEVVDIPTLKERRQPGQPLTIAALATWDLPAPAWQMAVTCALTGMLPKEYWGDWEVGPTAIAIHGTKRAGRERVVPRLEGWLYCYPQTSLLTFRTKLRESKTRRTPKDLRNSYAVLLELAGVPRTRRKLYLGHAVADVTDVYERHEVELHLSEDAALIAAQCGPLFKAARTKL